jgi:hypothetical protein
MDPWRCRACKRLPEVGEIVLLRTEQLGETILVECDKCRPEHRKFQHTPKPVHSKK